MGNAYVNDFNTSVKTYYEELKKCKVLPREREIVLLKEAKHSLKAKNEILKSNLKFVFEIAKRYKGYGVSIDDLISEGNLGLTKAIDKYDITKVNDIKFISYAVWWVRRYIQIYLDNNTKKNTHEVLNDECLSLRKPLCSFNDDSEDECCDSSIFDVVDDDNQINIENEELIKILLSKLSVRERKIVKCFFGIGVKKSMQLGEIGELVNLSKERVRQIKDKAIRKMRSELILMDEFESFKE